MRNNFFKKSFSVGYHNIAYTWAQLMLVVLSCIRCLESFEEGAKAPSAQTLRDRLLLDGDWLEYFHKTMHEIAVLMFKRFPRYLWYISVDETHIPFFGNRKKLNAKTKRKGLGKFVYGYKADTPGATGSFCFLVISLHCCRIRIPLAIKMVKVGESYRLWLEEQLKQALRIAPKATILADRGFGKATWLYLMLERLGAKYVVRALVRKKENKNKINNGAKKFQYWMTDTTTNEKALLTVYVARDSQDNEYYFATNIETKTGRQLLAIYMNRWDIENIFKDADRIMLPTSSRNPNMRLFTVVTSFFLFTLWQLQKILQPAKNSLRTFIKKIISLLCKILKCIITPLGELKPAS